MDDSHSLVQATLPKKNIGGNTIPVQIIGEWEVVETYPYLLL
jgi:hypothetical protein